MMFLMLPSAYYRFLWNVRSRAASADASQTHHTQGMKMVILEWGNIVHLCFLQFPTKEPSDFIFSLLVYEIERNVNQGPESKHSKVWFV